MRLTSHMTASFCCNLEALKSYDEADRTIAIAHVLSSSEGCIIPRSPSAVTGHTIAPKQERSTSSSSQRGHISSKLNYRQTPSPNNSPGRYASEDIDLRLFSNTPLPAAVEITRFPPGEIGGRESRRLDPKIALEPARFVLSTRVFSPQVPTSCRELWKKKVHPILPEMICTAFMTTTCHLHLSSRARFPPEQVLRSLE
ncbi:hypothetical protein P153DRAFT_193830 [Dothidotthia symphoricarpi CBS 119687]|uniref:Uncharacterized protein n=1 Tax=Dothidotthia symphoricarpi CBS 119687 TaxID=1392245 RepID=A0A6A6AHU7_9PLEO|nr:uncharacterized protein P153DRAFT_193830 [Dothidotthia symphoricarpi CBS 119687]KAF2131380.1 hypothetical protein P153DRAFT_193830 [Dothidotthia symphoricarpi CBS 119687]